MLKKITSSAPLLIIIILISVTLEYCSSINESDNVNQKNKPGTFAIAYLNGLEKRESNYIAQDVGSFDLGELKSSRDFFFLLRNTGQNPTTDISLSLDNDNFQISPQNIEILESDTESTLLPIIRVSALHGIALNGIGQIDLMQMGLNTTNMNIIGTTFDENNIEIDVELSAELNVDAKVMDIILMANQTNIDLYTPNGLCAISGWAVHVGLLRNYDLPSDPFPEVTNTGNVDISVEVYELYNSSSPRISYVMTPNETIRITLYPFDQDNSSLRAGVLVLDGFNTITDIDKLPLLNTGKVYLLLQQVIN